MITPILEKLILNTWAHYSTFSHAFGAYSNFEIPSGKFIVITDIIFYPFINQFRNEYTGMTYNDFFSLFNEYQLKIYNDSSAHFYQFRNALDIVYTGAQPFDLNTPIDGARLRSNFLIQPKAPIILPTYLTMKDKCTLLISRNVGNRDMTSIPQPLLPTANEKPIPNGVRGQDILVQAQLQSGIGNIGQYQPPGYKNTGIANGSQYTNNYQQLLQAPNGAEMNSFLFRPDTAVASRIPISQYLTNPLVTIGYVTVNNNYFEKLQQS